MNNNNNNNNILLYYNRVLGIRFPYYPNSWQVVIFYLYLSYKDLE